jgi:hypothetical protein
VFRSAALPRFPFVADRASVTDAQALMTQFGDDAAFEAGARADRSRDRGNVILYCRWRQIERMIAALAHAEPAGTIH